MIIKSPTLNVHALTSGRGRPQFRSKAYLEEMVGFSRMGEWLSDDWRLCSADPL